jgi:hypothetical protein
VTSRYHVGDGRVFDKRGIFNRVEDTTSAGTLNKTNCVSGRSGGETL